MIRHFLWLGVLSLLLMNCSGKEDAHDHAKESVEKESVKSEHSDEIVLAPEKAEAAGVKTETVQAGTFRYKLVGRYLPRRAMKPRWWQVRRGWYRLCARL